eukprot:s1163_g20.t1
MSDSTLDLFLMKASSGAWIVRSPACALARVMVYAGRVHHEWPLWLIHLVRPQIQKRSGAFFPVAGVQPMKPLHRSCFCCHFPLCGYTPDFKGYI